MNILIIDDARVMRNIIANAVRQNHRGEIESFEAGDGVEALDIIERNKIDIVFVDWNMPRLDGLEFVKKIRSDSRWQALPVIMITSEAARYMIVEAVKAGVTDYIVKPIVGEKLWEKIRVHFA